MTTVGAVVAVATAGAALSGERVLAEPEAGDETHNRPAASDRAEGTGHGLAVEQHVDCGAAGREIDPDQHVATAHSVGPARQSDDVDVVVCSGGCRRCRCGQERAAKKNDKTAEKAISHRCFLPSVRSLAPGSAAGGSCVKSRAYRCRSTASTNNQALDRLYRDAIIPRPRNSVKCKDLCYYCKN